MKKTKKTNWIYYAAWIYVITVTIGSVGAIIFFAPTTLKFVLLIILGLILLFHSMLYIRQEIEKEGIDENQEDKSEKQISDTVDISYPAENNYCGNEDRRHKNTNES